MNALWFAYHDDNEEIAALARDMWDRCSCDVSPDYIASFAPLLSHCEESVRLTAGRAIAGTHSIFVRFRNFCRCVAHTPSVVVTGALLIHQSTADSTLTTLYELFNAHASGLALTVPTSWQPRHGAICAVQACATQRSVPLFALESVLPFVISKGMPDPSYDVRSAALTAGVSSSSRGSRVCARVCRLPPS